MNNLQILPLKDLKLKKNHYIPYPLPNIELGGFCWCIVAPTASGKTVVVQNLINNVHFGMKKTFSEIIYISPTIEHDPNMRFIRDMDDIVKISDMHSIEHIDTILQELVNTQRDKGKDKEPILVVLDDMAPYLNNHGLINQLPQLSRHYSLSFVCSFQTYSNIPCKMRKNCSAYIIFRIYNKKDLTAIEDEVGSEYMDFNNLYETATKEKYHFLYLNNRDMSAWTDFTTLLWKK